MAAACEVDLLKEALQHSPVLLDIGPVVALRDATGLKLRALQERGILDDDSIRRVREFAHRWADDIEQRLVEEVDFPD